MTPTVAMVSRRARPYLFVAPAMAVLVALAFVPLADSLVTSFVVPGVDGGGSDVGLAHYRALWRDAEARDAVAFTLGFVAASVPLELVLGLAFALVLDAAIRWRGAVRAAILVPWAIPTVVTSWMWLSIFDGDRGLLNRLVHGDDVTGYVTWLAAPISARAAIVVADVWKTTPFVALVLLAGLQGIPGELLEAARLDGAGPIRRFFSVTLPLLAPALLVALLFRAIDAFRVFDLVYVMTKARAGTGVLQFLGYQRMFVESDPGVGTAVASVVFLLTGLGSIAVVRMAGAAFWRGDA